MRNLSPPLGVIESRLKPRLADGDGDTSDLADIQDEVRSRPMPAAIKDGIERAVAAQTIKDAAVGPGTIVLIQSLYGDDGQTTEKLDCPFAFCLDAKRITRGDISEWTGWMASPDCDYATDKDVLLEPDDGPFDLEAGMIQTWNPLTLKIPSRLRVLAQLSDYRLNIVREVGGEGPVNIPPSPGRIALRSTPTERTVLTGSPLQEESDPRIEYRRLYSSLAYVMNLKPAANVGDRKVEATASPNSVAFSGFFAWLLGHRLQLAGLAATLAGVIVASHMLLTEPDATVSAPTQVARTEAAQIPAPGAAATTPMTSSDAVVSEKAATSATESDSPPRVKERTEVAKAESVMDRAGQTAPKGSKSADRNSVTEVAKVEPEVAVAPDRTEVASLFLTPLKDQSFVVAMRGTGVASSQTAIYRLRLKSPDELEKAVAFLDSAGLRIWRFDKKLGTVDVILEKNQLGQSLDSRIQGAGLFRTSPEK